MASLHCSNKLFNNLKKIKMKFLVNILIAVFVTILLYSCGDDTPVTSSVNSGITQITGRIENWTYGDSLKLKAELYSANYYYPSLLDTSTIKSDGSFSVRLKTPPDNVLQILSFSWDSSCNGNVIIDPANVKTSSFISFGIYSSFLDSFSIGNIYEYNQRDSNGTKPGDFDVYYMYSNNYGSVSGTEICTNSWFYPDTTIFDIHGVIGWNKIIIHYTSITSNSSKILVNTTEPAGAKWWCSFYYKDRERFNSRKRLTESLLIIKRNTFNK
jgi:hypothetical protein